MATIGSGTIRRCGIVGVGMALNMCGVGWRKCVTVGAGFDV